MLVLLMILTLSKERSRGCGDMFNYDYYQGKKDAYNEFKEYTDFMLNNNIISDDLYSSFIRHIKNMQDVFDELQELELEKMRKVYE